ncbi:hypothetical protein [Rivibacter subsaxonicus]|uniref:Uncharacterized protein n=1 Tax=Rivibacter subsaxonicus TaxID=457575 RepID=A0A4Q7VN59_9BURK|nr:hypothetical protein [Rivibacter subsaxonicus]RZT97781.1 hypothetical protein EV670_2176 [Rivibacter subsaxonicus]
MDDRNDAYRIGWWENNLEALDRELARMAMLCRVRILEPGVIDRLIQGDDSVCAADNPIAFRKLHDLLLMHFAVRQKSADALGQQQTAAIERHVVERLKKSFPELATDWPRA